MPVNSFIRNTLLRYHPFTAENLAGSDEVSYEVIVQKPPSISGPKKETTESPMKHPLTLYCPFTGDPMPKITWFHKDQPITYDFSRKYLIEENGAKLTIENTGENDQGDWFCVADSVIGKDMKTFTIDIIKPPKITTYQRETERKTSVLEGAPLELFCEVEGSPKPDIVWSLNGVPLSQQNYNISHEGTW